MRGVALPMKDGLPGGRHRLRCESELDERANTLGEQLIVKIVELRPVVDSATLDLPYSAENVVKDVVEAQIAETQFVHGDLQVRLAVGANQRSRKVRTDGQ